MNTIVTFEDHGQDFLTWTIDPEGNIIDCQPFQFSIWSKFRVTNEGRFEVGGYVHCTDLNDVDNENGDCFTIKYRIENIQLQSTDGKTEYSHA